MSIATVIHRQPISLRHVAISTPTSVLLMREALIFRPGCPVGDGDRHRVYAAAVRG